MRSNLIIMAMSACIIFTGYSGACIVQVHGPDNQSKGSAEILNYHFTTDFGTLEFSPDLHLDNLEQTEINGGVAEILNSTQKNPFDIQTTDMISNDSLIKNFSLSEEKSNIGTDTVALIYHVNPGIDLKAAPAYTKTLGPSGYAKTGISMGIYIPLNDEP